MMRIAAAYRQLYEASLVDVYGPCGFNPLSPNFVLSTRNPIMTSLEEHKMKCAHDAFLKEIDGHPGLELVTCNSGDAFIPETHQSVYQIKTGVGDRVYRMLWPGLLDIFPCIVQPVIAHANFVSLAQSIFRRYKTAIPVAMRATFMSNEFVYLFHPFQLPSSEHSDQDLDTTHHFFANTGSAVVRDVLKLIKMRHHRLISDNTRTLMAAICQLTRVCGAIVLGSRIIHNDWIPGGANKHGAEKMEYLNDTTVFMTVTAANGDAPYEIGGPVVMRTTSAHTAPARVDAGAMQTRSMYMKNLRNLAIFYAQCLDAELRGGDTVLIYIMEGHISKDDEDEIYTLYQYVAARALAKRLYENIQEKARQAVSQKKLAGAIGVFLNYENSIRAILMREILFFPVAMRSDFDGVARDTRSLRQYLHILREKLRTNPGLVSQYRMSRFGPANSGVADTLYLFAQGLLAEHGYEFESDMWIFVNKFKQITFHQRILVILTFLNTRGVENSVALVTEVCGHAAHINNPATAPYTPIIPSDLVFPAYNVTTLTREMWNHPERVVLTKLYKAPKADKYPVPLASIESNKSLHGDGLVPSVLVRVPPLIDDFAQERSVGTTVSWRPVTVHKGAPIPFDLDAFDEVDLLLSSSEIATQDSARSQLRSLHDLDMAATLEPENPDDGSVSVVEQASKRARKGPRWSSSSSGHGSSSRQSQIIMQHEELFGGSSSTTQFADPDFFASFNSVASSLVNDKDDDDDDDDDAADRMSSSMLDLISGSEFFDTLPDIDALTATIPLSDLSCTSDFDMPTEYITPRRADGNSNLFDHTPVSKSATPINMVPTRSVVIRSHDGMVRVAGVILRSDREGAKKIVPVNGRTTFQPRVTGRDNNSQHMDATQVVTVKSDGSCNGLDSLVTFTTHVVLQLPEDPWKSFLCDIMQVIRRKCPLVLCILIEKGNFLDIPPKSIIFGPVIDYSECVNIVSIPPTMDRTFLPTHVRRTLFISPRNITPCQLFWTLQEGVCLTEGQDKYPFPLNSYIVRNSPLITLVPVFKDTIPRWHMDCVFPSRPYAQFAMHPCRGSGCGVACDHCCQLQNNTMAPTCLVGCTRTNNYIDPIGAIHFSMSAQDIDALIENKKASNCARCMNFTGHADCVCRASFLRAIHAADVGESKQCVRCAITLTEQVGVEAALAFGYCVNGCTVMHTSDTGDPYRNCRNSEDTGRCSTCSGQVHPTTLVVSGRGLSHDKLILEIAKAVRVVRRIQTVTLIAVITPLGTHLMINKICTLFMHPRYSRIDYVLKDVAEGWDRFVIEPSGGPMLRHASLYPNVFCLMQYIMNSHPVCTLENIFERMRQFVSPAEVPDDELLFDLHTSLVFLDACGMVKYMSSDRLVFTSVMAFALVHDVVLAGVGSLHGLYRAMVEYGRNNARPITD